MNIELVIFDWDGTLMDSERHIVASLRGASERLGIEVLSDSDYRNIIGLGMREAIRALYPERMCEDFVQAYTGAYRELFFDPDAPQDLFEGARETVEALLAQGYRLAVATGKSRRGLDRVFDELAIGHCFHASRCADETQSKPHPQMLYEILDELDIPPQRAVMIGDTEYDLVMAGNAGMPAIAAAYGVHEHERLLRHAPVAVIGDIREVPSVLTACRT